MNEEPAERLNYDVPEDAAAIGMVQDADTAFIFGFKTRREVFVAPGFMAIPLGNETLNLTAKTACDMLEQQAILRGMTITPEEISENLPENAPGNKEQKERAAAIVITAVRQAVANYAQTKKEQS